MGRSSWTSAGFNRATGSCPHSKAGNPEEKNWKFDHLAAAKDVRRSNWSFRTQRHDNVPNASQWSQHRSGAISSPSLLSAPKQSGNICATCRGIVDKAFADPAVRKRMTGKYMLDVFGASGFVAKATNHIGLRGICARFQVWAQE